MVSAQVAVFSALICMCTCLDVKFPPYFKFGASSSAYQVEGAWNASDKGESIWDRFTHADPTVVSDLSNGDVACDSYTLWRRDVEMASELGLDFYRFSISWPRLLPSGFSDHISEDGSKYYSDLIDGLLEKGIEPVITLYHFDLPQRLQDLGGWTNPLIVNWFSSYAKIAFSLYADRVKTWTTINEPEMLCDMGFTTGSIAPGLEEPVLAPFLCNRHVLLAHAKAWRIYDDQFKPLYHGRVSMSTVVFWLNPLSKKDYSLTKLSRDFTVGRYTHPIYSKVGGWPPTVEKLMKEASYKDGYDFSRLPPFTEEEIDLIRGTYDFFALNYYTCRLVRRAKPGEKVDTLFFQGIPELRAVMEVEPNMPYGISRFLVLCPKGLRETASWLKEQYGDIEILITENGYSSAGSNLRDTKRTNFIREHIEQVLLSIKLDGVNITGYTYWSLMDNFEWVDGYETKFGLYEVDFASPQRTRTPRSSASFYSQIIRSRSLAVSSAISHYFLK